MPGGSPKRAAALRFAEKARRFLMAGAYQRALIYFEKALGLDANPYFYYYLARAHYHLAHTEESLRFLDVAESFLGDQSDWMTEVETLRAKFDSVRQTNNRNVRPVALPIR
jgi:tetratricopeptide (TPR) repeat protein